MPELSHDKAKQILLISQLYLITKAHARNLKVFLARFHFVRSAGIAFSSNITFSLGLACRVHHEFIFMNASTCYECNRFDRSCKVIGVLCECPFTLFLHLCGQYIMCTTSNEADWATSYCRIP
jgi:hypothetical protein